MPKGTEEDLSHFIGGKKKGPREEKRKMRWMLSIADRKRKGDRCHQFSWGRKKKKKERGDKRLGRGMKRQEASILFRRSPDILLCKRKGEKVQSYPHKQGRKKRIYPRKKKRKKGVGSGGTESVKKEFRLILARREKRKR